MRKVFSLTQDLENCTILTPKGNSYCRRKSSARGPWFKVSFEGLSAEMSNDLDLKSHLEDMNGKQC